MEYQEVIPLLKDLSFELSRVETLAFSQLEKARLAYWEASRPGCLRGVAAGEGNFWNKSPWLLQRLKALFGGEIPDADLSFVDLDFSAVQHLESGGSGLFDSDRDEPVRWEDDPYWLVDSED